MSEAYFGLPEKVLFCKECVISNQRPSSAIEFKHKENEIKSTINFNENGICEACRYQKIKAKERRRKEYEKLRKEFEDTP